MILSAQRASSPGSDTAGDWVMMSPAVMTLASSPMAVTSITMSRSVTIPTGLRPPSLSVTTTLPMWRERISRATSMSDVPAVTVTAGFLQMSTAFMMPSVFGW